MGPRRILLIDDADDTLDLLELFLYNEYEILTAPNGFEGLSVAEKETPDLIITDITMPVMDGIRFINELRRRPTVARIPVMAVTLFAEKVTVKSLLNVGFCNVVFKPLVREALRKAVAEELEKQPAARE